MRTFITIKESIIARWLVLYYAFFFISGSYLLLQLIFTVAQILFFREPETVIDIHGFNIEIDGVSRQIWELDQFYISIIAASAIIVAMTYYATKLFSEERTLPNLGFKAIKKAQFVWFLYSLILLGILGIFKELLPNNTATLINPETMSGKLLLVIGFGLIGPFTEELLFRGFLLTQIDSILKGKRRWITIVISALLFALFHFQYTVMVLVLIFVAGLFLAQMRLKTNSLWFPIIFHCTANLSVLAQVLF